MAFRWFFSCHPSQGRCRSRPHLWNYCPLQNSLHDPGAVHGTFEHAGCTPALQALLSLIRSSLSCARPMTVAPHQAIAAQVSTHKAISCCFLLSTLGLLQRSLWNCGRNGEQPFHRSDRTLPSILEVWQFEHFWGFLVLIAGPHSTPQ